MRIRACVLRDSRIQNGGHCITCTLDSRCFNSCSKEFEYSWWMAFRRALKKSQTLRTLQDKIVSQVEPREWRWSGDRLIRVCASEMFLMGQEQEWRLTEEREQLTATGTIVWAFGGNVQVNWWSPKQYLCVLITYRSKPESVSVLKFKICQKCGNAGFLHTKLKYEPRFRIRLN